MGLSRISRTLFGLLSALAAVFTAQMPLAFASGPVGTAIQGTLLSPSGEPVQNPNVNFRLQILDKTGTCVLYDEAHIGVDLESTSGDFSLNLGGGTSRQNRIDNSTELKENIFRNDVSPLTVWGCSGNVNFANGDERLIRVSFNVGEGLVTLTPDLKMLGSVYASVASTLGGKSATDFVQIRSDASTQLTQANLESTFSSTNFPKLQNLLTTNFSDQIGGKNIDLSGVTANTGNGRVLSWDASGNRWTTSLVSSSATSLQGNAVANIAPSAGEVLKWNGSAWAPAADLMGITAFTGDVVSGGTTGAVSATIQPNAVTNAKIANGAITSAKINATGIAINRLLITDGTTGANVNYASCASLNQVMAWTANGWQCTTVASLAPVTSVAGKTGAVTLNAADIVGLGTAALKNVGTAGNEVVALDAAARLPALDGSALTNLNTSKLAGREVASSTPSTNQVLTWNGSRWEPAASMSTGSTSITTLGTVTTGTWNATVIGVPYGGTGSNNGSITGTGGLTFAAGGSNQNVTLTPSGAGFTILNGNVGMGTTNPGARLDVKGAIRLSGSTSGFTGFQPAAAAGSTVWTLPSADGTPGQVLSTNGSGVLNWSTASTGSVTAVNATAPIASSGGATPTISISQANGSTNGYLSSSDWTTFNGKSPAAGSPSLTTLGTITTGTWNGSIIDVNYGGTGTNNGSISGTGALNFSAGGSNENVTLNPSGTGSTVINSALRLNGNSSGYSGFKAADTSSTSVIYTLPPSPGLTNQVLTTDGNGMLSWSTVSSGGGTTFPLQAPNGIASTPSYSFTDSASTGWFSPEANSIALSTNGAERLRVLSNGNVGFGVVDPQATLDIEGSLRIRGAQNGSTIFQVANSATSTVNYTLPPSDGTSGQVLSTNGAGLLSWTTMASGGGITSLSASAPLSSSGGATPNISMVQASAAADGFLSSVDWTSFNNRAPLASPNFTGLPTAPTAAPNTDTTQIATTAYVLGQASLVNPQMNGPVSAGTSTKWSREDHIHPVDTTRAPAGGSTDITTLGTVTTGTWNGSVIGVPYGGTGTSNGSITGTGALTFAAGGANENVTLTPSGTGATILNGNIGVGTSSPTSRLEISSGTANLSGLKFTNFTSASPPGTGQPVGVDASGNLITVAGSGSGSGTVNSGTANQLAFYSSTGTAVSGNANVTASIGVLSLGQAGSVIGGLNLNGNTSGTVSINPQAAAGTYNFNLPVEAGTSGQVLTSGGGVASPMTWTTLADSATTDTTNASNISGGTLNALRLPAFTGDAITSAGSSVTTVAKVNGVTYPLAPATNTFPLVTAANTVTYTATSADTFTQYALLAGRAGGQTLQGGTGASNNLTLDSTSNVAKGSILLAPSGGKVGIGTTSPTEMALSLGDGTALDGGFIAKGYGFAGTDGATLTTAGAGTRMIWYPKKAAFRAGNVDGTQWDDANIGFSSFASGFKTKASSSFSTAMGNTTIASGDSSIAMGSTTTASGNFSTAMGYVTIASGQGSTASGLGTTASGYYSTASGYYSTAGSQSETVIGQNNVLLGGSTGTWVTTDPLFVIGNGTASNARANAMTVLKNGNVGIKTTNPQAGLDIATTGAASSVIIPRDSTANRPATAVNGMIRYNSTTNKFEAYENSAWTNMISAGGVTYPLTGSLGTVSAPTYSFSGDTDTGWYSPGAGILAAATNGLEWMRVDASGRVGIGTASPSAKLEISSGTAGSSGLKFSNFNSGSPTSVGQPVGVDASGNLVTVVSGSSLSQVTAGTGLTGGGSSGNVTLAVNVGTGANQIVQMDASSRLPAVDGGSLTNVSAQRLQGRALASTAPSANQVLTWNNGASQWEPAASASTTFPLNGSIGNNCAPTYSFTGDPDTGMYSPGDGNLTMATNCVERIRIDSIGNVGIKTTNPQAGLDIATTGAASSVIIPRDSTANRPATAVNGMIRYNSTTNKFEAYENSAWTNMISAGGVTYPLTGSLGTVSAPTYSFSGDTDTGWYSPGAGTLAAATNGLERMRVDASGRVGIGTASPLDSLDVSSGTGITLPNGHYIGGNIYYDAGWKFRASTSRGAVIIPDNNGRMSVMVAPFNSAGAGASATMTETLSVSSAYDSTGAVGIGIFNSGDKLAVKKDSTYNTNPWNGHGFSITTGGTAGDYSLVLGADKTNGFSYIRAASVQNIAQTLIINPTGGKVGIGTIAPSAKLEVSGAIVSQPTAVAAATVDLSTSNTHILASPGGTTITLQNMVHGGSYSIIVQDTTSRTYTFTGCNSSYFKPANGPTTAGTQTIYGVMTVQSGANWLCYITWGTGFQ